MTMWRSLVVVGAAALVMVPQEVVAAGQECLEITSDTPTRPEDVLGVWYPMEIVLHRNDSKIYGVPIDAKCPVVTFSSNKNKKILTMVWNASGSELTYTLSPKNKGQWQASGEQFGSMVSDEYRHYGGMVRVLRLEDNYMFLIFCSSKFRLLSTVAFSRDETMPPEVLEDALGILDRRRYKRAREIPLRPCPEDEDGSGLRVSASCLSLLSILPSLVVRFAH